MAAPVDFSRTEGALAALATGKLKIDDIVDDTGNVPPEAVHRMFRTMKPTSGIASYASLWERLWDDEFVDGFQAMSQWARDQVPFPGAFARQAIELLLRRNVVMSGVIRLGGRDVKLCRYPVPAADDHRPTRSHRHSRGRTAAERPRLQRRCHRGARCPAGHIGLAVSRQSVRYTIPELTTWLAARS